MPRRLLILALLVTAALSVVACATAEMRYVQDGGTYTAITVEDLASAIPAPSFADTRPNDIQELRTAQLTALRAGEDSAASLADILTSEFPADTASVPYYVEEATVDGQETWVVLEVWSSDGTVLDKQRLWVLKRESGDIVLSSIFN